MSVGTFLAKLCLLTRGCLRTESADGISLTSLHFVTPFSLSPSAIFTHDKIFVCEVPPHRAEQPSVCMYRGEMSSGDCNTRASQVPANSQLVDLNQGSASPRASVPYGESLGFESSGVEKLQVLSLEIRSLILVFPL